MSSIPRALDKVAHAVSKLHLRTYCTVKRHTDRPGQTLTTEFTLGPIRAIVICNIPENGKQSAPAYVKIEFLTDPQWWSSPVPPNQPTEPEPA